MKTQQLVSKFKSNQYVRVSDKPFNPKSQVQNIMYKRHHNAGHKKMTEFFNVYVKGITKDIIRPILVIYNTL